MTWPFDLLSPVCSGCCVLMPSWRELYGHAVEAVVTGVEP